MNVALIGASGMIGSRVLQELIARGHTVTALVRDPSRVASAPRVTAMKTDVLNAADLAGKLKGADAVVSAYNPPPGNEKQIFDAVRSLIAAAKQAGVRRVLIVGGAASLLVAPGVTLLETGHLPEPWVPIATVHRDLLQLLRSMDLASNLDWTYFSPAAFIQPGERTGRFRVGKDDLIVDEQGQSRISAEDYAIALVDELEHPRHMRERFTAGY